MAAKLLIFGLQTIDDLKLLLEDVVADFLSLPPCALSLLLYIASPNKIFHAG